MKKMEIDLAVSSLSETHLEALGEQELQITDRVIAPGIGSWIYENKPRIGSHLRVTIELVEEEQDDPKA